MTRNRQGSQRGNTFEGESNLSRQFPGTQVSPMTEGQRRQDGRVFPPYPVYPGTFQNPFNDRDLEAAYALQDTRLRHLEVLADEHVQSRATQQAQGRAPGPVEPRTQAFGDQHAQVIDRNQVQAIDRHAFQSFGHRHDTNPSRRQTQEPRDRHDQAANIRLNLAADRHQVQTADHTRAQDVGSRRGQALGHSSLEVERVEAMDLEEHHRQGRHGDQNRGGTSRIGHSRNLAHSNRVRRRPRALTQAISDAILGVPDDSGISSSSATSPTSSVNPVAIANRIRPFGYMRIIEKLENAEKQKAAAVKVAKENILLIEADVRHNRRTYLGAYAEIKEIRRNRDRLLYHFSQEEAELTKERERWEGILPEEDRFPANTFS